MSPTVQDSQAEAQIRSIVAAQVTAWDAGDTKAFAKDLAPDASFTNSFGMAMYGAALFTERHREILATFYKGATKATRGGWVTPNPTLQPTPASGRG